jgi:hypothetical protein
MALENTNADRVSVTKQLVDAMMFSAQESRPPTRKSVEDFAAQFTHGVIGKKLTNTQLTAVETSISEVMRGSVPNFDSTKHLRDALTSIHIDSMDTRSITSRFLIIGEEVRGPDDLGLKKME